MSYGHDYLHSHSALERMLEFPKHIVLVDKKYEDYFPGMDIEDFTYHNVEYIKVPIMSFYNDYGVFKNLKQ